MPDLNDPTLGQRVAELRRRNGLSQRDLAATLGRSESWVSQVERDVLPVERVSMLQALADALNVPVRDLRPDAAPQPAAHPDRAVNDLESLRMTLTGHPTPGVVIKPPPPEPVELDHLRHRVDEVWDLVHASRFADVSATLTTLLPELETARRGTPRRQRAHISRLLTRAYHAASAAFARQGEADAAWIAADRGILIAEQSGDPLATFASLFRMAHAFITLRRPEQAERVAADGAEALRPLAEHPDCDPPTLSVYGALHLVQAVVHAREGNRATTRTHIDTARQTAARLGQDRNDYDTEFGPTNVDLHAVSTAIDLGDAGEALALSEHIDATGLSPERQTRLHIDLAQAHAQRRRIGEALAALLQAERLAPEQVHTHVLARETIRDLLSLAGRRPPTDLVTLAQRAGVTP